MSTHLNNLRIQAPGKLFLSGEYAVLHGGTAIIAAVDRPAIASFSDEGVKSIVVENAIATTTAHLAARGVTLSMGAGRGIRVETPGFVQQGRKLGLGSSAAVCSATCGLLFEAASYPIEDHRDELLQVARTAHTRAQGGKGSGGDIAAAVCGGFVSYAKERPPVQLKAIEMNFVPVWSGRSALTTRLIEQVDLLAEHAPDLFERRIAALREIGAHLARAFETHDPESTIHLYDQYGQAMDGLGVSAGAPIWTPEHRQIAELARASGGACKPSGAGGGDLALALFPDPDGTRRFERALERAGFHIVDLNLGASGTHRRP